MIYRIRSEWEKTNECWIKAENKAQATGYLLNKNSKSDDDGNYIY